MSKKIIRIEGCDDCPFRNDYPWSTVGTDPTCNISNDKEIQNYGFHKTDYRPDWCELNSWDTIEIEL